MNTFLSTEQTALQQEIKAFVDKEIHPVARELDSDEASKTSRFGPTDALARLAAAGHLGHTVGKDMGGTGRDFVDLILIVEQIAKGCAGLGLAMASHYQVLHLLDQYGSDSLKSRYLPHLVKGEMVGAQAFGEERAGSDYKAVETAIKSASGNKLIIQGKKSWVVNGTESALLAVLAKDAETNELVLAVVDSQADVPAIKRGANKAKMGLKAASCNDIEFVDAEIPAENVVLRGKAAEDAVDHLFSISKTIVAAAAVGLAEAALGVSADYARGRFVGGTAQEGGANIAKFQGIQWKIADLSTESTAARLLTYRAAWSLAGAPEDFRKFAAMAKLFASRVARFHSSEAVQIFGMLGASPDSPVERIYRDSKLTEIFEGTSEIQKVILKDELGV